MIDNKFYIYIYLNPLKKGKYTYKNLSFDYEPFYIGKGSGRRYKEHINETKRSLDISSVTKKIHTIRKIHKNGKEPIIQKIYTDLFESSSYRLEKVLIKMIGRSDLNKGPLCNLTDGGEGISGKRLSEEHKRKISEKSKLQGWNKGRLGMPHDEETKQKISKANKGKKRTLEQKNKISMTTKLAMKNRIEVEMYNLDGLLEKTFLSFRDLLKDYKIPFKYRDKLKNGDIIFYADKKFQRV